MDIRRRTWELVEPAKAGDDASRAFDIAILTLIALNVLAAVLGTVQTVVTVVGPLLTWFEAASVIVFSIEYAARLWSCPEDPRYGRPILGRLRFMVSGLAIIDLMAILPFYLPFFGWDLRSLRIVRLLRVLRIFRIGRYHSSFDLIKRVLDSKKEELVMASSVMLFLIVIASSVLFYCENASQPEVFSSIPAAMWWAITTLTTVGYGDMYPMTVLGKVFAAIIAVLGIGMFALPTGILGAGFVEEIQRSKKPAARCPHCGAFLR